MMRRWCLRTWWQWSSYLNSAVNTQETGQWTMTSWRSLMTKTQTNLWRAFGQFLAGDSSIYILEIHKPPPSVSLISTETDATRPERKRNQRIVTMQSVRISVIMSLITASQSIPAPQNCHHQFDEPLHQSAWQEVLQSGTFSPTSDGTSHHLTRLKHKVASLEAVIHHNKDPYTWILFGSSFPEVNRDLESVEYNDIFNSKYHTAPGPSSMFSQAYEKFQLLYLATEVVKNDLLHHDVDVEVIRLWTDISNLLLDIIKNIYTEVVMQEAEPGSPLARSRIPRSLKCMEHSAYRDTRDFIILRHLLTTLQSSLDILDNEWSDHQPRYLF